MTFRNINRNLYST